MEPIKRIKRSESTWRELFARQAASGLSVLEFCRSEKINPGVFRRWRSVLNGDGSRAKAVKRPAATTRSAPFIDIGAMAADRPRFEVRLDLGGGMILSIGRG